MSGEIRVLSIVRAVAEMAEDNAVMEAKLLRLEEVNVDLQREIETLKATLKSLESASASVPASGTPIGRTG